MGIVTSVILCIIGIKVLKSGVCLWKYLNIDPLMSKTEGKKLDELNEDEKKAVLARGGFILILLLLVAYLIVHDVIK